jgi:hypothetical protein
MLGFGLSKVRGLRRVPVPPHRIHAFIMILLAFPANMTFTVINFYWTNA